MQSPVHHRNGCRVKACCHLQRQRRATDKPKPFQKPREQYAVVLERLLLWHEPQMASANLQEIFCCSHHVVVLKMHANHALQLRSYST